MADAREYWDNYEESLRVAMEGHQSLIQTRMPGIIVSYDAATQTAVVQPAIQATVRDEQGNITYKDMPPVRDVPVEFPSGGGFSLTHPVNAGDECQLSFASRSIDNWWSKGGVQPPPHPRMHSLSDATCYMGGRSKPRALGGVSNSSVQLRSDDGSTFVEIQGSSVVRIVAPTELIITTPLLTISGDVQTMGKITSTGDQIAGPTNISQINHKHISESVGSPTSIPIAET